MARAKTNAEDYIQWLIASPKVFSPARRVAGVLGTSAAALLHNVGPGARQHADVDEGARLLAQIPPDRRTAAVRILRELAQMT